MSVPVDSAKRIAPSANSRISSNGSARSITWPKAVVFSLLPVLVLLLLAEGGLRIYSWYFRTAYERYNASAGRLELVPGLQTTLSDGRNIRINSKGFIGAEFEDKKPEGVYRIFTLGDSCTFGGDWDMSYAAFLGKRLNAASKNFEVINAGIEGYNSEYALGRLKDDILTYSPDLVTIYIGWNDLMKQSPNTMSVTGQITWLGRILSNSYIYKGLSKVMFFHVRPALLKPQVTGEESEYHVFDSFVPATYEENVSAMVAVLHERNVHVILMTRPTALSRSMTLDDLRTQNIFFPFFPEAYSVPRLLSLHDAYNNSIRRLAARLQVPLVDLDEEFNRHDKKPLFWDTMHPSKSGHELIEKILEERIRQVVAPLKLQ